MPKATARPEQTAVSPLFTAATRAADALECSTFYIKSLGALAHAIGREFEAQKPNKYAMKDLIALFDYLAEDFSNMTDQEFNAMREIADGARHG